MDLVKATLLNKKEKSIGTKLKQSIKLEEYIAEKNRTRGKKSSMYLTKVFGMEEDEEMTRLIVHEVFDIKRVFYKEGLYKDAKKFEKFLTEICKAVN